MQDQEMSSGQSEETSGSTESKQSDVVAYDTYKKVLSEKKNTQAKLAEYETRLQAFEQEKMQAEGKQSELIDSLRKQLNERESALKQSKQQYAWNTLTGQIKQEALGLGCKPTKVDKLIRLLDDSELNSIEVDSETFMVNKDDVRRVLESAKSEVPEFFTSSAKIANVNPTTTPDAPKKKALKDMSREEIEELYKKHYK